MLAAAAQPVVEDHGRDLPPLPRTRAIAQEIALAHLLDVAVAVGVFGSGAGDPFVVRLARIDHGFELGR